jgi:hypothetical protein
VTPRWFAAAASFLQHLSRPASAADRRQVRRVDLILTAVAAVFLTGMLVLTAVNLFETSDHDAGIWNLLSSISAFGALIPILGTSIARRLWRHDDTARAKDDYDE